LPFFFFSSENIRCVEAVTVVKDAVAFVALVPLVTEELLASSSVAPSSVEGFNTDDSSLAGSLYPEVEVLRDTEPEVPYRRKRDETRDEEEFRRFSPLL